MIFILTKCYDEGLHSYTAIEANSYEDAVQYVLDNHGKFDDFMKYLGFPNTFAEFEYAIQNNYNDGDSWPEIRLSELGEIYKA